MKKGLVYAVLLLAVNSIVYAQHLTVVVSSFEARSGFSQDDADGVYKLFVAELVAGGIVKVVDRTSFAKITAELQFQASDWIDGNRVTELGKILGATSIIRCAVSKIGTQILMNNRRASPAVSTKAFRCLFGVTCLSITTNIPIAHNAKVWLIILL
jgi:hypothetical protein